MVFDSTKQHQTIGGHISLVCAIPLFIIAVFASLTLLGWGWALKSKLGGGPPAHAPSPPPPAGGGAGGIVLGETRPGAPSGGGGTASKRGAVKLTEESRHVPDDLNSSRSKSRPMSFKKTSSDKNVIETLAAHPHNDLGYRKSVTADGDEEESKSKSKSKNKNGKLEDETGPTEVATSAGHAIVVVASNDHSKTGGRETGTFSRSKRNDSSAARASSAAAALRSSSTASSGTRGSTAGEAFSTKAKMQSQNVKNLRLFLLMHLNVICSALCAAFDAWKKLGDFSVDQNPTNEMLCHTACKIYVFFYIMAKVFTYSFLGYKVLIVWEVRGEKSYKNMLKFFVSAAIVLFIYSIAVTSFSYGVIFAEDCIYRVRNTVVLFMWPGLDFVITSVLLYYFLKPIWESKQKFDSPRYRKLIHDNLMSGGIGVVSTQLVLMIVVPFSVQPGTISNLTGSLVSVELVINGMCQLLSVRKSWVRLFCSKVDLRDSAATAGGGGSKITVDEDKQPASKGYVLTGSRGGVASVRYEGSKAGGSSKRLTEENEENNLPGVKQSGSPVESL